MLFQPFAFAEGVAWPVIVGSTVSMLMPGSSAEAVLPARSSQVPDAVWFAPSVVTTVITESSTTPESSSVQVQVTETGPSFHALPFAWLRLAKVISGGVRSTSYPVWVSEAVLPPRSAQVPVAC